MSFSYCTWCKDPGTATGWNGIPKELRGFQKGLSTERAECASSKPVSSFSYVHPCIWLAEPLDRWKNFGIGSKRARGRGRVCLVAMCACVVVYALVSSSSNGVSILAFSSTVSSVTVTLPVCLLAQRGMSAFSPVRLSAQARPARNGSGSGTTAGRTPTNTYGLAAASKLLSRSPAASASPSAVTEVFSTPIAVRCSFVL